MENLEPIGAFLLPNSYIMKYNIYINQIKSMEYGLNLQQGAILDLIGNASIWADGKEFEDGIYYYLSPGKIAEEYPIITDKKNTILVIIKKLLDKNLIIRVIYKNKSFYKLSNKGKEFFKESVEKNQQECGKKSTPSVEKNQDNNSTSNNSTSNNILDKSNIEQSSNELIEYGNKNINEMQELIKQTVEELGLAYKPGKQERNRIQNILTAKDFGDLCDRINMTREQFVISIITISSKMKYTKRITNAVELYNNYASVYNEAMRLKKQFVDEKQNISITSI